MSSPHAADEWSAPHLQYRSWLSPIRHMLPLLTVALCPLARLKWDLDGERPLEFGSLISSSNQMVEERIAVETDAPLLWTTGLHQRSLDTK